MRRIIIIIALATSLVAFVLIVGTGLFLAGIIQSGERGLGVLLAVAGSVCFGSVLVLVFAPELLRRPGMRALGAVAAVLGVVPLAALSVAAFAFVGVPFGSLIPRLDWSVFGGGVMFAAGAVAVAALGWLRTAKRARPKAGRPEPSLYTPLVAQSARNAVEIDRKSIEIDEDVRVRQA